MLKFRSLSLYIMSYTLLKICTLWIQYSSSQSLNRLLYTFHVSWPDLDTSFSSPTPFLLKSVCSFCFGRYLFLFAVFFHTFLFPFCISLEIFIFFMFLYVSSHIIPLPIAFVSLFSAMTSVDLQNTVVWQSTLTLYRMNSRMLDRRLRSQRQSPARTWATLTNFNLFFIALTWPVSVALTLLS